MGIMWNVPHCMHTLHCCVSPSCHSVSDASGWMFSSVDSHWSRLVESVNFENSNSFLHLLTKSILRLEEVEEVCVVHLQEHPSDLPGKVHVLEQWVDAYYPCIEVLPKELLLLLR